MINVVCHFFGELGVQRLGRNLVTALSRREDIALQPVELGWFYERMAEPVRTFLRNGRGELAGNIGLSIGAADLAGRIVGQPRIAHVVWETTKIPEPFLERLRNADELWTPSTWGKRILAKNGFAEDRLRVVPSGGDVVRFHPKRKSPRETESRPFRFLCVGKWEARKGIDVLVRAFAAACDARCIAPLGSGLWNHRYDQSILSLIAYSRTFPVKDQTHLLSAHREELSADPLKPSARLIYTVRGSSQDYVDRLRKY
jgi:glycosyltransferase involved in cell wall biosynthesis